MMESTPDRPTPPDRRAPSWRAWLWLWIPVVGAVASLLACNAALDTYLWCATRWAVGDGQYYTWSQYHALHAGEANAPFYAVAEPPLGSHFYHYTERLWYIFKWGGEGWMMFVMVAAIALFYKRQRLMAAIAFSAAAIPGGLGWLIRSIDGRYRPTHHDGTSTWELFRGFHDGVDLAFPSGHATLAFADAAVLSYLFPRWRPLFLLLATCTAVSRVVQEAHFWSDTLFGAALGWTLAWLIMQQGDRYVRQFASRPPLACPAK